MLVQEWLGEDNKLGISIWERKYRNQDETFDEWLDRVSGGSENVKAMIIGKKFLFGGRILANRGLSTDDKKITYSNCYVMTPPDDNLESIFECAKKLARTYSYGGGVGVDLSKLAPNGAIVRNAAKNSSGAVSFMDLYSLVTGLISQNGRRGALMLSLSVDHPDIEEFIDVKNDLSRVTKANISIRVTDDFMKAVINDRDYDLSFEREETGERICKTVNARKLFEKIVKSNWDMGEPGMLFWDRIRSWNLLSEYDDFDYAGVNPCAEEPLPAGGSCLLGSINLSTFVDEHGNFDFDGLANTAFDATVALNDVLDEGLPLHPLQEQRDSVAHWRQIGLGVFGLADMLIKMGVVYGSADSLDICRHIASCILNNALLASATLACTKGPFAKYDRQALEASAFYRENVEDYVKEAIAKYGLRNSQLLTIPPTGTLSTMIGVSGGLEPIFANYYTRRTESLHGRDVEYKVYTPIVKKYMEEHGIEDDAMLPNYFVTSSDIKPVDRVKMQASWQQYIDASISSTVNLPETATTEDVAEIYLNAYRSGLKGITVFRNGCRRIGVLTTQKENKTTISSNTIPRGCIIETSDDLIGKKRKLMTGCGSLHCTAFFDPETGDLMETYLSKGSTGGCNNFMIGLSRMISLAARSGCNIDSITDQLNSSGVCPSYAVRTATKHDTSKGSCCPVAIANALKDMWQEINDEIHANETLEQQYETEELEKDIADTVCNDDHSVCPQCGEPIIHEGGCDLCKNCGWSKCN